ncbi:MAG: zinc ABC transporter substrate-binding protein [Pirellulales bacterium]|nr:zinc ABC transporter substrate-binding protein [Pirellulales bacterium]
MTRIAAAATMLALIATPAALADDGNKLVVVCSTTQIADFARQVGGDQVEVHSILAAGTDPHLYETKPGDAKLVSTADICFRNGLHLEGKDWMKTLATNAGKPIVTCTDGIKPLELDEEGQQVPDPHAWFSPQNAAVYVNNITRGLIKADPDHADECKARAKLYLAQLRALNNWITEQVNVVPAHRRVLVTNHDAFNYFCAAYGFKPAAPIGWSTGQEIGGGLTAKRRQAAVDAIRKQGVKAIFVETTISPKLIKSIADEAGASIGGELYSDSMGPPSSAGATYIGMMRENVLTIVEALK